MRSKSFGTTVALCKENGLLPNTPLGGRMKRLLMPLMVLSMLISCGKDNKVSSAAPSTSVYNPITTTVQGASDLGAKIDNYSTQFGLQQVPYGYYGQYQTYGTIANSGINLVYRYTKSTSSASGSNCTIKWSIFYVCSTSSSFTGTSVAESRQVFNNSVDITAKANELKAIINRANPLIPIMALGTSYRVQTLDGFQYVIDTRYPLQANPIGISSSAGTEYLYNITGN